MKLILFFCYFFSLIKFSIGQSNSNSSGIISLSSAHTWVLEPLLENAANSARLITPNVFINSQPMETTPVKNAVFARQVDFGFISGSLTAADKAAHPTIVQVPFTAAPMVPAINLPGTILPKGINLVLTRLTLAKIFRSNITMWSDPQIQATNSGILLPNISITVVVQAESTGRTGVFTEALCKFDPIFAAQVGTGNTVVWPFYGANAQRLVKVTGQSSVAAYVLNNPYSIGYAVAGVVFGMGNQIASLINAAGTIVTCNFASLLYTLIETGVTQTATGFIPSPDLSNPAGQNAWPIVFYSYLIIDKDFSLHGCDSRVAAINFFLWFLSSNVLNSLFLSFTIAVLPTIFFNALNIESVITGLTCNGNSLSLVGVNNVLDIDYAGLNDCQNTLIMLEPVLQYYQSDIDNNLYTFTSTITQSTNPFTLINDTLNNIYDVSFLLPELWTNHPNPQINSLFQSFHSNTIPLLNNLYLIPGFLSPINVFFSPPTLLANLLASISTADPLNQLLPLTLTVNILSKIYSGQITSWLDPSLVELNPLLTPAFSRSLAPTNLYIVLPSEQLSFNINQETQQNNIVSSVPIIDSLLVSLDLNTTQQMIVNNQTWISLWNGNNNNPSSLIISATNEGQVVSLVSLFPGSIGYYLPIKTAAGPYDFRILNTESIIYNVLESSSSFISSCTNNNQINDYISILPPIDPKIPYFHPVGGLTPTRNFSTCYPLLMNTAILIPSMYIDNSSPATTSSMSNNEIQSTVCQNTNQTITSLMWLLTSQNVYSLLSSSPIVRWSDNSLLKPFIIDGFNSIQCNGNYAIYQLPQYWLTN